MDFFKGLEWFIQEHPLWVLFLLFCINNPDSFTHKVIWKKKEDD